MNLRFEEARRWLAGGVNSPVRAFRGVGGVPRFVERAAGATITDADGRDYVDWVGSWGALIAGHAHPRIVAALAEQIERGTSYGAPTELETELARMICERVRSCERVRFVSSGTEAAMSAIRLARAATSRERLIKMDGCYHGHADSMLVRAGSGVATLGLPDSPGVPNALAALTTVVPFNDVAALEGALEPGSGHGEVAAVIVEPVAGNMGVVPPAPGYLQAVRELTRRAGALLIFDEVITGFRLHRGGAQALYDVRPDLTCFGKVIGGGLPAAAYGGAASLMERLAPEGPVYQAGTLSGNPLAMRAGIETLRLLDEPGAYERLEATASSLADGLARAARETGLPLTVNRVGSMLTPFFAEAPVADYRGARSADPARYSRFFHGMLERGIWLPPSAFEAWFVSLMHGLAEVERTVEAARHCFGREADRGAAGASGEQPATKEGNRRWSS